MSLSSLLPLVILVVLAGAQAPTDPCAQYMSCQACVAVPLCGWCSQPVVYPGNITGAQCAGFSPNGTYPFACNGIYSTEQCVAGYVCNLTSFTCNLGQPGQGNTLQQCEANCTNTGQVYLCNMTTHKCYQVPRGTPGSSSYAVCEAECQHPSIHPSPTSSPSPTTLYACNYSTGQCVQAPVGKGESKAACEAECQAVSNNSYICNKFLQKCVKLPPNIPGGETLAKCEQQCQVKPNPGPNPMQVGLWRGVRIDNNYVVGEFDLSINQTTVVFIGRGIGGGSGIVTIIGLPFYIPDSANMESWIQITSGPGVGQYIKTISDQSGQPGPETKFMTTAMSAIGGDVPSTINSAMTTATQTVFAFAACQTPLCIFNLRGSSSLRQRLAQQLSSLSSKVKKPSLADSDHCTQFGDSCQDCISHQFCGWCSTNVTYKDGSEGSQCAGFNSATNASNAWVCAGRYSTFKCDQGYTCTSNYQCVQTEPGNGVPLKICQQLCHPTPPPTPPEPQYVCNVTLKTCFKCNQTHCPGSQPLGPCEASCTNPKPGPHGNLVGEWRGIRIQNGYQVGEIEMVFTKTNVSVYADNQYQYTANVTSMGADLMLLKILDGTHQGWSFAAIYQESQEYTSMYEMITFAKGVLGQSAPASYDQAMYTSGMEEYALAKCNSAPCQFNPPTPPPPSRK